MAVVKKRGCVYAAKSAASTAVAVGCLISALFLQALSAYAAPETTPALLKPDQEVHLTQVSNSVKADVRIGNDFLCADLGIKGLVIVAQAPLWTVRVISQKKQLYYEVPLQEWLRRGCPLNFIRLTAIPEWTLVPSGHKKFLNQDVLAFSLPFLNKQQKVVPLESGHAGELLALDGQLPTNAARIMGTLFQTPKSNYYPLQMRLKTYERNDRKFNDVFVFSGSKENSSPMMETNKISVTSKHPLPGLAGLKLCHDPGALWTDRSDVEGMGQFLK